MAKLVQKAVVLGEVKEVKRNDFKKESKVYLADGSIVVVTDAELISKFEIVEDRKPVVAEEAPAKKPAPAPVEKKGAEKI